MKKWRNVEVDRVLDGIDAVHAAREHRGLSTPLVTVNCVVTRDSLPELPELIELLGKKGVARITLLHLIAYDPALAEQSVIPIHAEAEKAFARVQTMAKKYRMQVLLPPKVGSQYQCQQPLRSLFINWNGDVRPCCMSTLNEKGALLVGNLTRNSLPELWNSGYMHQLRKALDSEKDLPDICLHCPMRRCDLQAHTHIMLPPGPER
jgi:radical SAM protein with 4Fe4S-binding SPASM domain